MLDLVSVRINVDLDEDSFRFADWLTHELLNLFVPVRPDFPGWMRPSVVNGRLAITTVPQRGAGVLWRGRGHLYASSANRTGSEAARTTAEANAAFDDEPLVLDDPAPRDPSVASGSATIVRVGRHGDIELVRQGVNDAMFGGDHDRFLRDLIRRWKASHVVFLPANNGSRVGE